MEILHTTNEEPFVSGTGHFAGWENRLMKLEDTAILFCREGHAHIMIVCRSMSWRLIRK